jgi:phosphatidylglycerophosphate synthase
VTEGELWVRQALGDLRATGAVTTFLLASHRRAAEVRRQRPALARQSRAWSAAGAAAWLLPPFRTRARAGLAWWSMVAVMLDWHLGMVETEDGEPRMLGAADACTLLRAWLVPVVAADPAPLTCVVGGLSDVLDGRLARAGEPTRAGRDLEGLVDAAFAVAALRGLDRAGRLPTTATAAEAARVTAGFGYGLAAYFARAERPDDGVIHAARATTVLRAAGVAAAAAGHRRAGTALVLAGCAWSVSLAAGSRASSRAGSASRAA